MKHVTLLLAAALSLATTAAVAEDFTAGSITISNPWARATPKGSSVGAAYMTITNNGTDADRLVDASTSAASKLEVHEMSMKGSVMTMRPVTGGLEIKPGQSVVLKPDSFHLMLVGLKGPLVKGQQLKATLEFAKAGKVDVDYPIEAIGASGPEGATGAGTGGGNAGGSMGNMGNMGGTMGGTDHPH